MKGWKTWVGAAVAAIGAFLAALGYDELSKAIIAFGGAIIAIGLGHKLEKR